MRISDWSSDVCSSDLRPTRTQCGGAERRSRSLACAPPRYSAHRSAVQAQHRSEERRVGKECVSRVDLGGRRIIKKKNKSLINLIIQVIEYNQLNTTTPTLMIHISRTIINNTNN